MAAVFALLASGLWGTSDFCGGVLSRRRPVTTVVFLTQAAGTVALVLFAGAAGLFTVDGRSFAWGAAAGAVGLIALTSFYRALATGKMGIVAPIAAMGVAVPVVVGLATGDRPSVVQLVGIVLAAGGVVVAARPQHQDGVGRRAALMPAALAGLAAAGFGSVILFVAKGSEGSVAMTLLLEHVVPVTVLGGFLVSRGRRPVLFAPRRDLPLLAMTGCFDLTAIAFLGLATQRGLVSVVAVLSSLYPVVTVLLARRLLHERLARVQWAGIGGALVGVLMLAAG